MTVSAVREQGELLGCVGDVAPPPVGDGLGSVAGRRAVEDAAVALTGWDGFDFGQVVAPAVWRVCQDVFCRDPWLARLLALPVEQVRHVREAVYRTVEHYQADGELLAVAALLTWASGADTDAAVAYATAAIQVGVDSGLAPLVIEAIDVGLPMDTWQMICADLSLDALRGTPTTT